MKSGSKAAEFLATVAVVLVFLAVLAALLSMVAVPLYFFVSLALDALYVEYNALLLFVACYVLAAILCVKAMDRG